MKHIYSLGILLLISIKGYTQQIDSIKTIGLNEVIISANKVEETQNNVAQQVQVFTKKDIQQSQANTTADLLSNAGIPVQRSQLGGGSPVLRGFESSRIVLMIDGVRMNNLIYRGGHLQDIIKTDNSILERVEVLYGPSSTIYGSDALGGVIHLYTKKAALSADGKFKVNGNVLKRYQSAANAKTEHVDMNIAKGKLASLTSITYSEFGDLMTGKNQNPFYANEYGTLPFYSEYRGNGKDSTMKNPNRFIMKRSGYSQHDVLEKISIKQNDKTTHEINLQYSSSSDVPRYDRLSEMSKGLMKNAEWYYGPQTRALASYNLNYTSETGFLNAAHVGMNYQNLEESRHNRTFNNSILKHRIEQVDVIGLNVDLFKRNQQHEFRFGLDGQYNMLQSKANSEDIITGESKTIDSRYPDGSNMITYGALYFSHTYKINPELTLVDGLRGGFSLLHSTLNDTAIMFSLPYKEIEQRTPMYSGNIGIISKPNDHTKVSFMVSTGYRVPNIDDMSKIFGSSKNIVIVPNTSIRSEKTVNYELGITTIMNSKTKWETSLFYTDFYDITVVDKFQLNGKDSLMYDGTMSRVYANQNKGRAYIYGLSTNLTSALNKNFSVHMMMSYQYGRIKTDSTDYPLDHISPFYSRLSLRYNNKKFSSDFYIVYNGWKRINDYYLNGEDNEQYATPQGIPAWFTLNVRASYTINKYFQVDAGIDNILDTQYRVFASGINAPGRNMIVALRANF